MSEDVSHEEPRWFPSRTEAGVAVLHLAPAIGALLTLVMASREGRVLFASVPLLAALVVYVGTQIPREYGVDGRDLIVRAGLLRMRVRLSSLLGVRTLRTWLGHERVEVFWGEGPFCRVRLAPREHHRFLRLLEERTGLRPDDSSDAERGTSPPDVLDG